MKLLRSIAVAYLYFPHVWFVRIIGPRLAVLFSRLIAWCNWLLTFFGAERKAYQAISESLPELETKLSARSILLRYLQMKHQNLVEWLVYPTKRGRRYSRQVFAEIEGREYLDSTVQDGNGAILAVYHFGLVKLGFAVLEDAGYVVPQHVIRGKSYAGLTYNCIADAVMNRLVDIEIASGSKPFYHKPMETMVALVRHVRGGGILGMNADGMGGEKFVDAPFLQGTLSLPLGPAQVAAYTGAPLIPMFAFDEGLFQHRLVLHAPIYVTDDTSDSLNEAVFKYAKILEDYVKLCPWQWWTWRRITLMEKNGAEHYHIQGLPTDETYWSSRASLTTA